MFFCNVIQFFLILNNRSNPFDRKKSLSDTFSIFCLPDLINNIID